MEAEQAKVRPLTEWPRQTEDLRRLWQLAEAGRVPHAVLLCGSPTATAEMTKFLAKLLLCEGSPAPCGQCRACRWFDAGTHPDYHTLEATGAAVRAAHVQALQQALAYRAHTGRRSVYVLEGADNLTPVVANRLLKTLEEPPGPVVALLTAEHPGRVLPTVKSRCFIYRVDDDAAPEALGAPSASQARGAGAGTSVGREPDATASGVAAGTAEIPQGAPGDDASAASRETPNISEQHGFAAILPAVIQWMETMLGGRKSPFELADELLALAPSDAAMPLDVLLTWLRDVLHVKLGDEARIQHRAWSDDLHKQAQLAPTQGLVQAIDLVLDAKTRLTAHVAPQFNYAQMCIRMRRACASPRKDEPRFA